MARGNRADSGGKRALRGAERAVCAGGVGFPKARIALETGKAVDPGRTLYDMDTYSEAALLRAARTALEAQGFRASDFGDAAIEALARLDEREDAQYIRSLRAYLSDGLNLRRAAERLGVHRNTLAYRMRRIEARFALDLSDMNTCFELLFSLWLKEGLGGRADDEPTAAFDRDAARAALWRFAERAGNAARTEARFSLALAAVAAGGLSDAGGDRRVRGGGEAALRGGARRHGRFAAIRAGQAVGADSALPVCAAGGGHADGIHAGNRLDAVLYGAGAAGVARAVSVRRRHSRDG